MAHGNGMERMGKVSTKKKKNCIKNKLLYKNPAAGKEKKNLSVNGTKVT